MCRARGPKRLSSAHNEKQFHLFIFWLHLTAQRKRPLQAEFNLSAPLSRFSLLLLNEAFRSSSSSGSFPGFSCPVSSPLGPGAAETCAHHHPPPVCSLAASPVLCTPLFMSLRVNNNLKELSLCSLGLRHCEAASRS